jgi:hypothetical protein
MSGTTHDAAALLTDPRLARVASLLFNALRGNDDQLIDHMAHAVMIEASNHGCLNGHTADEIIAAAQQSIVLHVAPAPALPAPVAAKARTAAAVNVVDFVALMTEHRYIYTPTGDLWPKSSVDARLGKIGKEAASTWLDQHHPVEQQTWAPGEPQIIPDRLIFAGGWIPRPGVRVFNLYRPPHIEDGNPLDVDPWLTHLITLYPDEADHIIDWLAHRVQRPGEKINHALVLGGAQGVGKDTLLEPVKYAVGPWNFTEVGPSHITGRFNGFVKSVVLRINEARDLGDLDRYAFYEHTKAFLAAPPDVLRCDEKNVREYSVANVMGVIFTSNHKTNGIYLPPDDRRHFVAWSEKTKDDFSCGYWTALWEWYRRGGFANVAAYLRQHGLSAFDCKAPPPKTPAWHEIVNANRAPEDAELADVLDVLNNPAAVTIEQIVGIAHTKGMHEFAAFLTDRKNVKRVAHRLEATAYVAARNPAATDGLWRLNGRRQAIYSRRDLPERDRIAAADRLTRQ